MSDKVIWLEGMVLSPQHLQQSDSLADASVNARLQLLSPFYYGLASLEIDRDSLDNGFFAVRDCSGIFPDGTHFSSPRTDPLPDQRPFESFFPAAKESLGVHIALPAYAAGNANLAFQGAESKPARYLGQGREITDGNSGGNAKEIVFGRLNLRLLFDGESPTGFQTLKIAELARDGQGRVHPSEVFFPASVRAIAAQGLMAQLKKLMESCLQKSNYLMGQRAQKSTGIAQFNAEAITNYLLLSAINGALPEIIHFHNHPFSHPEVLFRRLLGFAGSLISFGQDAKAADMPKYVHGDLQGCFRPLFQMLDTLLGVTVPTGYRIFPLTKTSPIQYSANMKDADFNSLKQFYLGVSAQASEVEIITTVQRKTKLGPVGRLEMMVNAALPGIPLVPETNAPQAIPAKAGYKYFRLQQGGDLWDQVMQTKAMAIHMPSDLPSTKLELVATTE
ncbi:MAG TPA: type VI secretion system baseplate subunit TssK [Fibrobacteria bacterium]|nr:type VI secretion system baseplate subunit TssK [Fibrobacteria bacterium]